MNKLIIIGNGFDLAHDLKTSYSDFIDWYLEMIGKEIVECESDEYESELFKCKLNWEINTLLPRTIKKYLEQKSEFDEKKIIQYIKGNRDFGLSFKSELFQNIFSGASAKKWVDIENEYYRLLVKKSNPESTCDNVVVKLNKDLMLIQSELIEYLKIVEGTKKQPIEEIRNKIYSPILKREICLGWNGNLFSSIIEGRTLSNEIDVINTIFLSFNYTNTVEKYVPSKYINYIHGKLDEPKNIIFGYGDELDDNYRKLEKYHSNKCLDNIKSIRYSETPNYRMMLEFIASDVFQVCIMGHSCGNSDRTLLNTIFEHKNCVSIKPYYYIKEDGTDNYSELVQNISRNFKDKRLMRNRVVNKEYCETIK